MTSDVEEDDEAHQLGHGEGVALILDGQECREKIVSRRAAATLDHVDQIRNEFGESRIDSIEVFESRGWFESEGDDLAPVA